MKCWSRQVVVALALCAAGGTIGAAAGVHAEGDGFNPDFPIQQANES